MRRNAFTLIELMVVVLIIGLLIAILLPSLGAAMEAGRQIQCASNLNNMGKSFQIYKKDNEDQYPAWGRGMNQDGVSQAGSNTIDTINSLWLMVTTKNAGLDGFTCPSDAAGASAFKGTPETTKPFPRVNNDGSFNAEWATGAAANTTGKRSLSYSYQIPNGTAGNPGMPINDGTRFAIMADRAPPITGPDTKTLMLVPDAAFTSNDDTKAGSDARKWLRDNPNNARRINSPNHAGKGQNVLFQDGHVKWHSDPWVGIGDDNIYTRAAGDNTTAKQRVTGTIPAVGQLPNDAGDFIDSVLVDVKIDVFSKEPE